MGSLTASPITPVVLLVCSNVFMTFAWYGHLKFKDEALWLVVLASWGIAFFEYALQVPANRIGFQVLSLAQLKILRHGQLGEGRHHRAVGALQLPAQLFYLLDFFRSGNGHLDSFSSWLAI